MMQHLPAILIIIVTSGAWVIVALLVVAGPNRSGSRPATRIRNVVNASATDAEMSNP